MSRILPRVKESAMQRWLFSSDVLRHDCSSAHSLGSTALQRKHRTTFIWERIFACLFSRKNIPISKWKPKQDHTKHNHTCCGCSWFFWGQGLDWFPVNNNQLQKHLVRSHLISLWCTSAWDWLIFARTHCNLSVSPVLWVLLGVVMISTAQADDDCYRLMTTRLTTAISHPVKKTTK